MKTKTNGKHTRQKILDAALQHFSRRGFFETGVDEIARAAGVAKGTVYLYFKDKPDIYIAAIDEHFKDSMAFLHAIESGRRGPRRKLEDIADNFMRHMTRFQSSWPMISLENINLAGRVLKDLRSVIMSHMHDVTRLIARIVDEGITRGEFRRVDAEVAAIHFLSAVRTAFVASVIYGKRPADGKSAFDFFFRGLQKRR